DLILFPFFFAAAFNAPTGRILVRCCWKRCLWLFGPMLSGCWTPWPNCGLMVSYVFIGVLGIYFDIFLSFFFIFFFSFFFSCSFSRSLYFIVLLCRGISRC